MKKEFNPIRVVNTLATAQDRASLAWKLNMYKINLRESNLAKIYLDNLEKITKIRR